MQDTEPNVAEAPEVDISAMDFAQLSVLRTLIDDRVREMWETEGRALREEFIERAGAISMSIEEIVRLVSAAAARPRTRTRVESMAKMYRVYSVIERPKQDDSWLNIGMAYAHEKGDGFNVILQVLPLHGNGRLVLRAFDPATPRPSGGEQDVENGQADE